MVSSAPHSSCLYLPSYLSKRNISPIDFHKPDFEALPKYAKAKPIEFILEPGETLFLPGRWAHQVDTIEASIAMNFWWSTIKMAVLNFS